MSKMLAQHFLSKRWGIPLLMVLTALVAAAATIALPLPHFAHASGATLTVNPAKGPYSNRDDQIPVSVSGFMYTPGEVVKVYWNYTGPGTGSLEATATTNAKGNFTASFLHVLAAIGTYTIAGVGQSSGSVATGTYTQLSQLYLRPQAGGPGSVTTIYGNAYGAGETVKIYWNSKGHNNGTLLATAATNSTGSFTVNATIPTGYAPGVYSTAGVGQTSKATSTSKYTIYTPTLALAPLKGSANTQLTVSAYGFTGLETVDIFWNNGSTPVASAPTSGFGYLAPTTITVPAATAPGSYPVKVVGRTSGLSIKNTYTVVAPGSSLSVMSGPVGIHVAVTGQGYAPGETAHILWNYTGPGTGNDVADVTVGLSGTVRGSFTVPTATSDTFNVGVVGATSGIVTQSTFTTVDGLASNPASSPPGQNVTAVGSGFQANETVQLYWNDTSGTPIATATAGAAGRINQTATIPTSAGPGMNKLIGVGQTSGSSFTTSINVNTNWGDFGFDPVHHRVNPYEFRLGPSNVANLQLKWTGTTAVGLKDSPVYANGVVYVGTMDGLLNAYNATSGTLKWQFNPNSTFRNYSAPAVDPALGLVFLGTVGNSDEGIPSAYYAVDTQTGTLQWSVILNWHQVSFPTIAFNTLYVGTSHLDHNASSIYAIDEVTGYVRWQYTADSGFWGAVGADPNTNTVFTGVGNPDAAVLALNATTGAVIWNHSIAQYGPDDDVGSGISVINGLVYASSKNGRVYALHEDTGAEAWSTPIGKLSNGDIATQAVSDDGVVYLGTINGFLYALNANTGAILWDTKAGPNIFSSPAEANGVVYFSSFNHKIYALNASTGAIIWTYTTGANSYSSPIVVNGWLYCGSADGNLYAFSL